MAFEFNGGAVLTPRVAFKILILTFPVGAACKSVVPLEEARVVAPPPMPVIQQHVEPVTMPVQNLIQRENPIDPVALIIVEAQLRFERGEDLYKQGFLKRAKDEFDSAIDILLESSSVHQKEPRLQREITELVSRVHALELAAIRDGDGFTDQAEEHAAIDDLQHVETFPSSIDPKLKQEVEEEIEEVHETETTKIGIDLRPGRPERRGYARPTGIDRGRPEAGHRPAKIRCAADVKAACETSEAQVILLDMLRV